MSVPERSRATGAEAIDEEQVNAWFDYNILGIRPGNSSAVPFLNIGNVDNHARLQPRSHPDDAILLADLPPEFWNTIRDTYEGFNVRYIGSFTNTAQDRDFLQPL